jgi:hypothetical protein
VALDDLGWLVHCASRVKSAGGVVLLVSLGLLELEADADGLVKVPRIPGYWSGGSMPKAAWLTMYQRMWNHLVILANVIE